MKLGIAAGRILGLPLPGLPTTAELISQRELSALQALEANLHTEDVEDALVEGLEAVDDAIRGALEHDRQTLSRAPPAAAMPAVDRSYRALEQLVKKVDPELQHTGLIKTYSPCGGLIEWVSEHGKQRFEELGRRALEALDPPQVQAVEVSQSGTPAASSKDTGTLTPADHDTPSEVEDALNTLKGMLDAGLLTPEEYETKRAAALAAF